MKRVRQYKFTLVEILVSMAVFSILLVLMMQFFSGARVLWTANEKRAAVYSDAGTALDLMTTLLQSTFCVHDPATLTDQTVFEISARSGSLATGDDMIVFVSNSLMDILDGNSVRYLCLTRDTPDPQTPGVSNNTLYLKVFSDKEASFASCFYEFPNGKDKTDALNTIKNAINGFPKTSDSKTCKPILRNVTGLSFIPLELKNGSTQLELASDYRKTPMAVRIELSLMENEEKIKTYQTLSGQEKIDFQKQHEYTFRRTVWLGKRDATL